MEPLIAWRPLRAVVSAGLVAGALGTFATAYLLLLFLFSPLVFLGAFAGAVAALPAAVAVWRGRASVVQTAALVIVLGLLVAAAIYGGVRAAEAREVDRLGVPTESDFGFYAGAAGVALLSAALLLAAGPRLLRIRATAWACALLALTGAGSLALAAVEQATTTCADSRIDPAAWRAGRADDRPQVVTDDERIAAAVVECRLLHGRSKAEVLRALGKPDRRERRTMAWTAGWVFDGLGPGDGQELILTFGRHGRVTGAELAFPLD